MNKIPRILLIVFVVVLGIAVAMILKGRPMPATPYTCEKEIIRKTWQGYRHFFIRPDGRVHRPKDNDTVSEGQAYAMLRAVWMNDQETFDRCYRWTEEHLSRKGQEGDHLLAWHWQDGKVVDRMPASDADVDYALSLVIADALWGKPGNGMPDYGEKAHAVLSDIMEDLTFTTDSGRRYLAPWLLAVENPAGPYPQNPSYYSPAHFRIFGKVTGDPRWMDLVDTTYFLIESLSRSFDGKKGTGLMPDWCQVDRADRFSRLDGKSPDFGWEAVRVPLRVLLDQHWFQEPRAASYLQGPVSEFLAGEWRREGKIFCEYEITGSPKPNRYEDPLFYTAYGLILKMNDSPLANDLLAKVRLTLQTTGEAWMYLDTEEYFVNSLAWLSEAVPAGIIRHYLKDKSVRDD